MGAVKHFVTMANQRLWPSAEGGDYLSAARRRLFAAICMLVGVSGAISGLNYIDDAPLIALAGVVVPFIIGALPLIIPVHLDLKKFAFAFLCALGVHLTVMAIAREGAFAVVYLPAIPLLFGLLIGFKAGLISGLVTIGVIAALSSSFVPGWLALTTGILTFGITLSICIFQLEIERTTDYLLTANEKVVEANRQHKRSNQLLEATLRNIEQGVVVYNADMEIVAWNKSYATLLEFPEGWLRKGRTIEEYFRLNAERGEYEGIEPGGVETAVFSRMMETKADAKSKRTQRQLRRRPNGKYIEILGNPMPDGGIVITYTDITDKEEARQQIERLAWTDTLTGLNNRNSLRSTMVKSMNIAKQSDKKIALLLLDLDRFKPVNDTYGHAAGDAVLQTLAKRMKNSIRSSDYAFRLGGDEFALIVFFSQEKNHIYDLMPRLLKQLETPIEFEGREIAVGASIGISFYPDNDENPDELIRKADTALYEAKDGGRNCYRIYDELVDHKAQKQRRYEDDLRNALKKKEFELLYQAKYSTAQNRINGAEALIRWRHPEYGLISPADFIPIVERSDLVFPVGAWVLRTAWRQAHQWIEEGSSRDFSVSVNVSARQFFDTGFLKLLRELAASRPDLAQHIDLEITEEVTIGNVDDAARIMQEITEIGFTISVDDFGTGYSSISYLHKLPVHCFKIDKSFLDSLAEEKQSASVIQSMIELGHNLGIKVVAEGVETEEQMAFLRQHNCDEVQGYLIGKPISAEAFTELLPKEINATQQRA